MVEGGLSCFLLTPVGDVGSLAAEYQRPSAEVPTGGEEEMTSWDTRPGSFMREDSYHRA